MKIKIEWLYKAPKGPQTVFQSEEMKAQSALKLAKDIERTGRVKSLKLIDEKNEQWTVKNLERFLKELDKEPHDLVVYFDGSYEKETTEAGVGIVVYYTQGSKRHRIRKNSRFDELSSNNEAEYAALWLAVLELEALNVHHLSVVIRGDSQVVLQQLAGEWPVYDEEHNRWIDRIEEKLASMKLSAVYELLERKDNKEADQLASQALRNIDIESEQEIE
ncbi:ribonuclease H family protein [Bacillus tianshenii]|nr:ribonuclease H family protein [Bacillus tianshenii]